MSNQIERISKNATVNEKTSWERKRRNMSSLIEKLTPIEEQILELESKRSKLLDEVVVLRQQMVHTCIHPASELVDCGDYITCKFCNRKLNTVESNET